MSKSPKIPKLNPGNLGQFAMPKQHPLKTDYGEVGPFGVNTNLSKFAMDLIPKPTPPKPDQNEERMKNIVSKLAADPAGFLTTTVLSENDIIELMRREQVTPEMAIELMGVRQVHRSAMSDLVTKMKVREVKNGAKAV